MSSNPFNGFFSAIFSPEGVTKLNDFKLSLSETESSIGYLCPVPKPTVTKLLPCDFDSKEFNQKPWANKLPAVAIDANANLEIFIFFLL